jgi:hypothetical protein
MRQPKTIKSRLITMIVGGAVKRFFENAVNTIYRDAIPFIELELRRTRNSYIRECGNFALPDMAR